MKRVFSLCFVLALLACLAMPVFAGEALEVIEITGLTAPVPGRNPSFRANLLQSDVAKIANISWMDLSTDSYMSGTDTFRYSTEEVEICYRLEINVMITDSSVVWTGNGIAATVNGVRAEAWRNDDVYATVIMDYYMPKMPEHTCSGGYATCIAPAKCATCGKEYGRPNPENHDVYGYKKAENDSKYTTHHDLKCDLCKKTIEEEAHRWGPLNHNNVRPCTVCWYTPSSSETHTCSGGGATCVKPGICDICGKEYLDPENHELYSEKKAENDGKYTTHHDVKCEQCKKTIKEEEHSWGPPNENNVRPCTVCWYTPDANIPEHTCSGGTATCCEKAICTTCNKEYGEFDENAHTYLDTWGMTDEKGHAKNCIACGQTSAYEAHVPSQDDPNICGICGYPIEEPAGKPLSKGAVIAIAAGGTVAVGGGATGAVVAIRRFRLRKSHLRK